MRKERQAARPGPSSYKRSGMKALAVGLTGQVERFEASERGSGARNLPAHEQASRAAFVKADSNNAARFAMGATTRWGSARISPLSLPSHFSNDEQDKRALSFLFPGGTTRVSSLRRPSSSEWRGRRAWTTLANSWRTQEGIK